MKQIDQKRKDKLFTVFVIGIVLASVLIMEITFHLLFHDTTLVLSHLFYFPVIMVAILWPERGIIASTVIALLYLVLLYIIVFPDTGALITGTMQFYVYVSVGIAISMITYRMKTSEKKYQRLFQHSGSGVVLTDASTGTIIEANKQYYEMTSGFRSEEDKSRRVICNDKMWRDCLEHLQREGTISNLETDLQIEDKNLDLLISAGMVNGDQIVVTITDITERKKAESELKKRNEQLYVINQVISTATSSMNTDECLNLALGKVLELLHFEGGAIFLPDKGDEKARITAIISTENAEKSLLSYLQAIDITAPEYCPASREGTPVFRECSDWKEDENCTFSSATIPLISRGKIVGVMVVAGGYEHRFTEEERELLRSIGMELGNALLLNLMYTSTENARMEANFYLDVMMHDINNANTASLGYGEILCDYVGENEKPLVAKILSSVRQSIDIIRNVSMVRHLRSGRSEPVPVSLEKTIRRAVSEKKVPVTAPDTDLDVLADRHLTDLFSRLIENSRLHGGDETSVVIKIEDASEEVIVSVEDNGRGLPDTHKERLFRRFFTGQKSAGGKGISLSICRMIVEGYGGEIWAEDRVKGKPEEGLAVRFTLKKARIP